MNIFNRYNVRTSAFVLDVFHSAACVLHCSGVYFNSINNKKRRLTVPTQREVCRLDNKQD